MSDLLRQLQQLPDGWGLVAVAANKRAYQDGWQRTPLTREQVAVEIRAGRAKAVGVLAGPPSGGLLFVDHDGPSATAKLEELGLPLRELPHTVCVTSGRDGRFQAIYRVPEEFWPAMRGQRVYKTGVCDEDGKAQQLDLRWSGHQSVVLGAHPETSGYRWIRDRSPADVPVADAPVRLIELLLRDPEPDPAPLLRLQRVAVVGGPVPLLEFVSRETRDLVESGGTPGSWNDDQLRMALDLVGVEEWLQQQGRQGDISAREAFAHHIAAAKAKAPEFSERKAWARFDGALKRSPVPSTPEQKLRDRLAYHSRPPRAEPQRKQPSGQSSEPNATARPTAGSGERLQKVEAHDLMRQLREIAADGQALRWNTFSQQIELNGQIVRAHV